MMGKSAPGGGNIGEVLLRDPRIPVVLQFGQSGRITLVLAERPLVHDAVVVRPVEETGRYPWLHAREERLRRRSARKDTSN